MSTSSSRPIVLRPLDAYQKDIDTWTDDLCTMAHSYGIDLTASTARSCVEYLLYIQQVNEIINLTRITDIPSALVLHLLDSLVLARWMNEGARSFLDMGTGAGFPGVPLHLATDVPAVLLDSVGKKVRSVDTCCHQLGISGITTVHDRLESYAQQTIGSFDIVVARALAPLPVLLEYATPFLVPHGQFIVAKGLPSEDELSSGLRVAGICGLECVAFDEFDLPGDYGHRSVYVYERVTAPSIELPRPSGMAKRHPLA